MLSCALIVRCGLAIACLSLAACDNTVSSDVLGAPTDSAQAAVEQDLQGSWLREYEERGVRARRLLVLDADGSFRESVRVTDPAGAVTAHQHEGTWLYDGTNLKRKYTSMDGKPPSRLNLPFVALELKFESKNEFTGTDRVHKNEVRYRRVQTETLL